MCLMKVGVCVLLCVCVYTWNSIAARALLSNLRPCFLCACSDVFLTKGLRIVAAAPMADSLETLVIAGCNRVTDDGLLELAKMRRLSDVRVP